MKLIYDVSYQSTGAKQHTRQDKTRQHMTVAEFARHLG